MIEVLIVCAVMSALASIGVPLIAGSVQGSRADRAVNDLRTIQFELDMYARRFDAYPITLADVGLEQKLDPWGSPYQYLNFDTIKGKGKGKMRKDKNLVPLNTDYDLYSMGPDGDSKPPLTAKASRDDIVRANDGDFIGPASSY